MRRVWLLLLSVASCEPSPASPASSPPVRQAVGGASFSSTEAPRTTTPSPTDCAQHVIDLPASLPPCAAPGTKEYDTESDLEVELASFPGKIKPGAAVDFMVTMKNLRSVPLRLQLADPQTPSFEVYDARNQQIEPPLVPPSPPSPRCAHAVCLGPIILSPPSTAPPSITLAPGGIARSHATWHARRWGLSPAPPAEGCCDALVGAPVDRGPLSPGAYIVDVRPPLGPYDGSPGVTRARADLDVEP